MKHASASEDRTVFGRVALLMGGWSAEREISIKSGTAVAGALSRLGVSAHPVDPGTRITSKFVAELANGRFDRCFVMLHGRGGEDGCIQGTLEALGLPYTGSGVIGSAIGMDKYRTKLLWSGAGLPTADFVLVRGAEDFDAAACLGFPLMLKPANEGSSLGMSKVDDASALPAAWETAHSYDSTVLAERWIEGTEYTCAILGTTALPLIRLETPNAFYDFDAKYKANTTSYICPCGLAEEQARALKVLCWRAFDAVGASGWGRVDFMLDREGNPFLLEINTVPGMTDHSLVPMAAKAAGIEFDALVERILLTSLPDEAAMRTNWLGEFSDGGS